MSTYNDVNSPVGPASSSRSDGARRSLRYRVVRGVLLAVVALAVALGIATLVYELTQDSSGTSAYRVPAAQGVVTAEVLDGWTGAGGSVLGA